MVVDVIVSNSAKAVDKAFSYAVPEELCDEVEIGRRVIVPFARGNREIEGFCVAVHENKSTKGLKKIVYLSDEPPVFGEKLLEVIEYMHERYLCGYHDIINTIVPAGTAIKLHEVLFVPDTENLVDGIRKDIVDKIKEYGEIERNELCSMFETNINTTLRSMIKDGIVCREFRAEQEIKTRTMKFVRAEIGAETSIDLLKKRAPIQAKVLNELIENGSMPLSELIKNTSASHATVKALEQKGLVWIFDEVSERDPFAGIKVKRTVKPNPTQEQLNAITKICKYINNGGGGILLHGVTGSGKTEVFLQSIEYVLSIGKTALVLVPEISLTPQMVSRFISRFGSRVAVMHSGLSRGERYDQWRRIYNGEADIVIGARSAVFAPLENIGIIIMDEEHSESYKSDMSPRYHAREIALFRAKQYGAAIVFASATPLVESYYKAQTGEYKLIEMRNRFNNSVLPAIHISDMRNELAAGNRSMFSRVLYREMKQSLERKEQIILFLNRRGFSTFVSCRSCGYTVQCPNCNISLTYHKFDNMLRCHYCGYAAHNYTKCPECGSSYIRFFGGGTQRVEDEVKRIFPGVSTIRMDVDTTGKKQSHEKLLKKFDEEKIDILIGTQMVAKGLDYENVTLVGAVSADTMLHINDFRSAERTFSMLEQVAGRAGRGSKPGRAVIQTYNPDAEAIRCASAHDYYGFYKGEIELRKLMWYPPFSKMIVILFTGTSANIVARCAAYFKKCMGDMREIDSDVLILGPIASAVSRINRRYRYQMIIKCNDDDAFNDSFRLSVKACSKHEDYKNVSVIIDKNPSSVN